MASGEIRPDSKTLEPRRVTSRSSCRGFNWCDTTRAILRRQELEPTSMAAKVGMGPRYTTARQAKVTRRCGGWRTARERSAAVMRDEMSRLKIRGHDR